MRITAHLWSFASTSVYVLVLPVEVGAACGLISAGFCVWGDNIRPSKTLAAGKLVAALTGSVGVKVLFLSLKYTHLFASSFASCCVLLYINSRL